MRKADSSTARAALWRGFSRVMAEDQPCTWLRIVPHLRFVKPEISNVNTYPKGLEPWEFFRSDSAAPAQQANGLGRG